MSQRAAKEMLSNIINDNQPLSAIKITTHQSNATRIDNWCDAAWARLFLAKRRSFTKEIRTGLRVAVSIKDHQPRRKSIY
jgi:hypothetical protein